MHRLAWYLTWIPNADHLKVSLRFVLAFWLIAKSFAFSKALCFMLPQKATRLVHHVGLDRCQK